MPRQQIKPVEYVFDIAGTFARLRNNPKQVIQWAVPKKPRLVLANGILYENLQDSWAYAKASEEYERELLAVKERIEETGDWNLEVSFDFYAAVSRYKSELPPMEIMQENRFKNYIYDVVESIWHNFEKVVCIESKQEKYILFHANRYNILKTSKEKIGRRTKASRSGASSGIGGLMGEERTSWKPWDIRQSLRNEL